MLTHLVLQIRWNPGVKLYIFLKSVTSQVEPRRYDVKKKYVNAQRNPGVTILKNVLTR